MQITASYDDIYKTGLESAHSFIQFGNAAEVKAIRAVDYYALIQQKISLVVTVTQRNSNDPISNAKVIWEGVGGATVSSNAMETVDENSGTATTKTNPNGITTLELSASDRLDLAAVYPECDGYDVSLSIEKANGDEKVSKDAVALHWVKPGIYYRDEIGDNGKEYRTETTKTVIVGGVTDEGDYNSPTQYRSGESWKLGTKVVGIGDGPVTADGIKLTVDNIENVKIDLSYTDKENTNMTLTNHGNGVGIVRANALGLAVVNAKIDGLVESQQPCKITMSYTEVTADYKEVLHTFTVESVGEGVPSGSGGELQIPINWVNSDISSIYLDYDKVFSTNNSPDKVNVYALVKDTQGNPCAGVYMDANVTDDNGTKAANLEASEKTDKNGYIKISFSKPSTGGNYTINTSVRGGTVKASGRITFTEEDKPFTLDKTEPSDDLTSITLTFSSNVSTDKLNELWFKKFFDVKDSSKGTLDIASITKGSSDNQLVLTLNQQFTTTSSVTVDIEPTVTLEEFGITHYLLSSSGVLYTKPVVAEFQVQNMLEAAKIA